MAKRCNRNYEAWLAPLAYFLIIAGGVMLWETPRIARAQQMGVIAGGELEYQRYCAVCHGSDARGQGVMSKYLTIHPANLTQLAKRNGGKFPFWEVYEKIDGGSEVRGHGTREMPIWGDRFRADAGGDGKAAQTQAAGRILGLVFYLQYIQE
jgi:mono/diheme cytochrome c family protein